MISPIGRSRGLKEVCMWYSASAPASMMFMGEYAVLEGFPALVFACEGRIIARVRYREDNTIQLLSEKYGHYETNLQDLQNTHDWRFVLKAISIWKNKLLQGIDVEIISEFSDQEGLGSSAAVSVAMNHVLAQLCQKSLTKRALLRLVRRQIRAVQGMGSGADVAAAIYGGFISYDPKYLRIEKYLFPWCLYRYYMGYKTPTPKVFSLVKDTFKPMPDLYHSVMLAIAGCVRSACISLKEKNKEKLMQIISLHQEILETLGICDKDMQNVKMELLKNPMILAVKISGSGLGDCLMVFTQSEINMPNVLLINISSEGVRHEKA